MTGIFEFSIKQLKALVNDSERCAREILDACEKLGKNPANSEQVTKIIEACHFQDFTGQRAAKIIAQLEHAKSKVGEIETKALTENEKLMQGPQAKAANQKDIDKLFDA